MDPFRRGKPPGAGDRAAGISGTRHRPWRVLLADDDDDSRELCAEFLTSAGYEVSQAQNGLEAIDTALRRNPDLIVMDLQMPVMGGLEAIQRLRDDSRTSGIPIVVLSANAIIDHQKAKLLGCRTCLVKPCGADVLEGVIRTLIDAKGLELASQG